MFDTRRYLFCDTGGGYFHQWYAETMKIPNITKTDSGIEDVGDLIRALTYLDPDTRVERVEVFTATGDGIEVYQKPIDMVIFCPACHKQHIDAPEPGKGWYNPPHTSHLCHYCGRVFRLADVPTNGVPCIQTKGKADTWQNIS